LLHLFGRFFSFPTKKLPLSDKTTLAAAFFHTEQNFLHDFPKTAGKSAILYENDPKGRTFL